MNKQRAINTLCSRWIIVPAVILGVVIGIILHWGLSTVQTGSEASAAAVSQTQAEKQIAYWTCSMHPQVHASGPGLCPFCGMELIPVYEGAGEANSEAPILTTSAANPG